MNLSEFLKDKTVPEWIKQGEKYKNRKHEFVYEEQTLPLYELDIKYVRDLRNVMKAIEYFEIKPPYPLKIWQYILNPENMQKSRKFFREEHFEPNEYFLPYLMKFPDLNDLISKHDEIELLKWITEANGFLNPYIATFSAADGAINCLKYSFESGETLTAEMFELAATYNSLECLIFLHDNDCSYDHDVCGFAAEAGSMDCLKYLCENNFPYDEETFAAAAISTLECVKYLHSINCKWNEEASANAAEKGNFEILKFLHEHGCPWGEDTTYNATEQGSFSCLTYAVGNGCPINIKECLEICDDDEILVYLEELSLSRLRK
jgi:hypothetical protein